jgi:hypothetical protein
MESRHIAGEIGLLVQQGFLSAYPKPVMALEKRRRFR